MVDLSNLANDQTFSFPVERAGDHAYISADMSVAAMAPSGQLELAFLQFRNHFYEHSFKAMKPDGGLAVALQGVSIKTDANLVEVSTVRMSLDIAVITATVLLMQAMSAGIPKEKIIADLKSNGIEF